MKKAKDYTLTKLKKNEYLFEKNGISIKINFNKYGRYDKFDGEYSPAWLVFFKNETHICLSKDDAINKCIYLSNN